MVNVGVRVVVLCLERDFFDIKGQGVNDLDWYEFEIRLHDEHSKQVGGEDRQRFIDSLIAVLSNRQGGALGKIEGARFAEYVGGVKTEYRGSVVFLVTTRSTSSSKTIN